MLSVKNVVMMKMKKQKKAASRVVPFLRQAAYYFDKGNNYYRQNKMAKALLFFNKTVEVDPGNSLYHYNLACILSRMGYLERANKIFSRIVNQMDPTLTDCYFLMAVNHGLMDELEKARFYLNMYLQLAPDGEMVEDAEELLFALNEEEFISTGALEEAGEAPRVSLCAEEEEILCRYREDEAMRRFLWQSLYHENTQLVERAIRLYGFLREAGGERNLKEFVRNPWIKQRMRIQALLELKNMGVRGLLTVYMDGALREIDLGYYPLLPPRWLGQWQEVLNLALTNMQRSNSYDELFYEDAQAIWIDYINNIYPRAPGIKKKESWAAALEYALARYHFLDLTQKKLADQYGVSTASISTHYREFNRILNIEHRAYHNILRYLAQREPD